MNFSFILGIGLCKSGKPEIYFLDRSGVAVPESLPTLSKAATHFKITCAVYASGERSEGRASTRGHSAPIRTGTDLPQLESLTCKHHPRIYLHVLQPFSAERGGGVI